jgi:hypothetical protein
MPLSDFRQLNPQFMGSSEQSVLDRTLGGSQDTRHRPQAHAVVVLKLEHYPFTWRQPP